MRDWLRLIADDLHVDRSRQAEIENLRNDVRRQEGEGRSRKQTRKPFPQTLHIFPVLPSSPSLRVIRRSASPTPIVPELP